MSAPAESLQEQYSDNFFPQRKPQKKDINT